MLKRIILLIIFLSILFIFGCTETKIQPKEITINPSQVTMLINHSQEFVATVTYIDELESTNYPIDPLRAWWTTTCGIIKDLSRNKIEFTAPSDIGECILKAEVPGGYSKTVNIIVYRDEEVCKNPPIKDTNLEKLIEKQLGIARKVNCSDLASLEELIQASNPKRPKNEQIKELEGLRFAGKLSTLKLPNNQIAEIYELAYFKNLSVLSLYNNALKEINVLRGLPKLTELYLGVNSIESLEPLEELSELEELYIFSNKIKNIYALEKLAKLKIVQINNNNIFDISALSDNQGFKGGDHRLSVVNNCLDLRAGSQDMLNINELKKRGVKISYQPQLRCR